MSDYFLGEIRMFSFNWAPIDWALCNGATLQANQNAALFSLLGNKFGGNGQTTFCLPDLRGRAPLCAGVSPTYGTYATGTQSMGGVEGVTLTAAQVPSHTHAFKAISAVGTANLPAAADLVSSAKAVGTPVPAVPPLYGAVVANPPSPLAPVNPGTLNSVGGGAHNNMQPFAVTNFCISTVGIYPPRP